MTEYLHASRAQAGADGPHAGSPFRSKSQGETQALRKTKGDLLRFLFMVHRFGQRARDDSPPTGGTDFSGKVCAVRVYNSLF